MKQILIILIFAVSTSLVYSQQTVIQGKVSVVNLDIPYIYDTTDAFLMLKVSNKDSNLYSGLFENNFELKINHEDYPISISILCPGYDYEISIPNFNINEDSIRIPDLYITQFYRTYERLISKSRQKCMQEKKLELKKHKVQINEQYKEIETEENGETYYEYVLDGTWTFFGEKKTLLRELNYKNYKLSGKYSENNKNGELLISGYFENDEANGEWGFLDAKTNELKKYTIENKKIIIKKEQYAP